VNEPDRRTADPPAFRLRACEGDGREMGCYAALDDAIRAIAQDVSPAGGDASAPSRKSLPAGRACETASGLQAERQVILGRRTSSAGGPTCFEILCCAPDGVDQARKRPRHQFYVNARATGSGGDGTESTPWWGLSAAADGLLRLHQAGKLDLDAGQSLRLSHREVFTASSLEKWKKTKETIAKYVFMAMAMMLVAPVIAILTFLLIKAWPVLSPSFVFENPRDYMTAGGIWAPLVGTFLLVLLSLLVAAPVGILAGVYLNEYAPDNWFTRTINLAVVNLAGVPSIVHALFGVGAFVFFAGMGRSLLAASCTVAVMTLPVIITSTREALAAVPMTFREACWNMGASRWQTIRTIVLPNSISGILTGVILQVSRAAGETAPILFTGAVFFTPELPSRLSDRFMALSMHLFTLCTQVRGVSDEVQYGTAAVLIGLVLAVNSLSIGLRVYLRSRKKW
jgi:phosphate transport system permease protein